MIKYVAALKQPPSMTVEEFHKWWLETHAAIASRLPGLRKYVISLATNVSDEEPKYNKRQYGGIGELWFDSMDDLERALASHVFMEEITKDAIEHNVTAGLRMAVEEHVIM